MISKPIKLKKKMNIAVCGILWTLVILFLFSATKSENQDFGKWSEQSVLDFGKEWTYAVKGENRQIDVPISIGKDSGPEVVISKMLPDEIKPGDCIFTATCHSSLQVLVAGKIIYQYGQEPKEESYFVAPPNAFHTVQLDPQYAGKEVKLIFSSSIPTYMGKVEEIQYGDRVSFLIKYIKDHFFSLVTGILILGVSLVLFVVWLAVRNIIKQNEFLYLSLLSFNMFLWQINETYLPQFLIGHTALLTILAFEAISLLPVSLLFLLKENASETMRSVTSIFLGTSIAAFLICNVLFLGKIMDFAESAWIVHFNLVAGVGVILFVSLTENQRYSRLQDEDREGAGTQGKQRRKIQLSTWGFLFMSCTVVIDVVNYYIGMAQSYNLVKIGLLVYTLTFSVDSVRNGFKLVSLGEKAAKYENLAYKDMLTGVRNRTAYKEAMQHLDESPGERMNAVIVVIDINNLKMVNDAMGHAVGDRYIQSNVELIKKHFDNLGKIFRIGGDEFVVLIPNGNEDQFRWALHKMEQDVDSDGAPNFAFGYAYFETEDGSIQNTARRADALMYQKKQKQKQKQ